MKTDPILAEIAEWEDVDRIRSILKLHDPRLRQLDCRFSRVVLGWKNFRMDKVGCWFGTTPDGVRRMVPAFSYHETLARKIVTKIKQYNLYLEELECFDKYDKSYRFFFWTAFFPEEGKHCSVSSAHETTGAEAICLATIKLFIYMSKNKRWKFRGNLWKWRQKKPKALMSFMKAKYE